MEFASKQQTLGLRKASRLLAATVVSKAAQEAKLAAGGKAPPGLIARFFGYFINRKKRFIFLGVLGLVLYFAQKKGYTQRLLAYSLKKVEERVQKEMEKQQSKLQNSMEKSSAFSKSYKDTLEKLPGLISNRLKILASQNLGLDKIKEQLRNKTLTAAEKTKCWQALRAAILQAVTVMPILKSYLTLLYSVKDILISKYNRKLVELVEKHKLKESKFLHNSVEATKSYLSIFFDLFAERAEQELLGHFKGSAIDVLFPAKVTDKVSVEWFTTRLSEVTKFLFCKPNSVARGSNHNSQGSDLALAQGSNMTETSAEPSATTVDGLIANAYIAAQPDILKIERKMIHNASGRFTGLASAPFSNSGSIKYQFKHKRIAREHVSFSSSVMSIAGFIKGIFWSPKQSSFVETKLADTFISASLLSRYRDYSIDSSEGLIVRQLLHETNRRSTDKLSVISETDEKHEDHSELVEEPSANPQPEIIYEDMSGWEGKDMDCQQSIIKTLEEIAISFLKEFLDIWTGANPQVLLEYSIESSFKKLSNRLFLLAHKFTEYRSNELVFAKLITALNTILDEEIISSQAGKNDLGIYEARTKELVKISKQQPNAPIPNVSEVEISLRFGEEAKLQALYTKAERELCARIFLDEEFEEIFGGEEDNKQSEGEQFRPGAEQEDLFQMMSRLNVNSQLQLD